VRRAGVGRDSRGPATLTVGLARLRSSREAGRPWRVGSARQGEGVRTVKKLLLLLLVGLGVFAVWRKVQADRAELDLWTEATTNDD
jgi:hypothetical protein